MSRLIRNVFPLGFPWRTQDPFLFCAYHLDHFPTGNEAMGLDEIHKKGRMIGQDFQLKDGFRMYHGTKIPGFPYHPHRGFETITINKQGVVDHTDSLGAAGRFMADDVQWMTAGKGVQHSEMFPLLNREKPNTLEIFQVWLNLPSKDKLVPPAFKMLWAEEVPKIEESDQNGNKVQVDLIAGNYKSHQAVAPTPNSWAAQPEHFVRVLTVQMEPKALWTLPATDSKVNRSMFFYEGSEIEIGDQTIQKDHTLILTPEQDISVQNGSERGKLLILEGVPINEPVVQHGPYVMTTEEEIRATMREYGRTQFGGWPWQKKEVAHPRSQGRFALHADGTKEEKS